MLDEYATGGDPHWGIQVVGDYVYLADGASGLSILSYSGSSTNSPPVAILRGRFTGGHSNFYKVSFKLTNSTDPDNNIVLYEMDYNGDGIIDDSFTPDQIQNYENQLIHFDYGDSQSKRHITPKLIVKDAMNESSSATCNVYFSGFQFGRDNFSFTNTELTELITSKGLWEIATVLVDIYENLRDLYVYLIGSEVVEEQNTQFGLCSGMAASSSEYYLDESSKPLPGDVFSWSSANIQLQEDISEHHTIFNIKSILSRPDAMRETPQSKSLRLKWFLEDDEPPILSYSSSGFGHSIVPTGMIRNIDEEFSVISYDNINPSTPTATIALPQDDDTWIVGGINPVRPYDWFDFLDYEGTPGMSRHFSEVLAISQRVLTDYMEKKMHKVSVRCPVDVVILDDMGGRIGELNGNEYDEIQGAYLDHKNESWLFDLPVASDYSLNIYGKGFDSAFVMISIYNADNTLDLVTYRIPITPSSQAEIKLGREIRNTTALVDFDADGIFECSLSATDWSWQTNVEMMLTHGTLSGTVSSSGVGLIGVAVDLYDSLGNLIATAITNNDGDYDFGALENGEYVVAMVTPLGYNSDEESQQIAVMGLNEMCIFILTPLDIIPHQRGRGYWMHQVNALLSDKGNPHETYEDMCDYMELIRAHFNQHGLNPVNVFEVILTDDCNQRLEALRATISPKGKATMNEKARAHLTALLLNMVSGKIAQWHPISEDSLTVSQAITYCNILISDGNADNDEAAKDIAEMINEGQIVPAGMLDPTTANIAYKQNDAEQLPTEFSLSQNYPNPFNPSTEISFALPDAVDVKLDIFNIMGQRITSLINAHLEAGLHSVVWDGKDSFGRPAASGIYFYRLEAGIYSDTKKMILMK
ncbi:MAG: T9SS type A sorting domain-containing protein [Candidatus Zixiibacteriota bacterium]